MAKLRLVQPEKTAKFEPPRRQRNTEVRAREYLTLAEVRKVRSSESDQAGGGTGRSGAVGPDRNGMTRSEILAGSDRYCSWGF